LINYYLLYKLWSILEKYLNFCLFKFKKVVIIFIKILLAIIFGGGDFLVTLKPDSERALVPLPTFSYLSGEKIF